MREKRPGTHQKRTRPVHPGLAAARKRDQRGDSRAGSDFSQVLKSGLGELEQAVKTAMTNDSGIAESRGQMESEDGTMKADFGVRVQFGLGGNKGSGGKGGGGGGRDDDGPIKPDGPSPTHGRSLEDKRFEMVDMGDFLKVTPPLDLPADKEAVFIHQKEDNRLLIQDKESGETLDSLDLPCSIDLAESGPIDATDERSVLLKKYRE